MLVWNVPNERIHASRRLSTSFPGAFPRERGWHSLSVYEYATFPLMHKTRLQFQLAGRLVDESEKIDSKRGTTRLQMYHRCYNQGLRLPAELLLCFAHDGKTCLFV